MSTGSMIYSRQGQVSQDVGLSNTLIDVMLLIGMDNITGLQPERPQVDDLYANLFLVNFDPSVLTAISAKHMVHFFPFPHPDLEYPPHYSKHSLETRSLEMMEQQKEKMLKSVGSPTGTKNSLLQSFSPKKSIKRSMSQNPKLLLRSKSIRRQPTIAIPDLPVSDELMRAIPSLCFPDGMKVHRERPENFCHYFVLTNMMGEKSFACCLTFCRTFHVEEDDQGNIYMNVDVGLVKGRDSGIVCYVPQCVVSISSYPYFTRMKECLSSVVMRIERDPEEMIPFLRDYAHILTHTPVPPAGNISVELNLYQMPVTLMPSSHPDRPVIDVPLHNIFLCFSAEEFLKILACVLLEERMVFLSRNYALLSVVMEGVRNLILPFKWRFTYVTSLPSNGLGYLQAPGVFMFGCHSKHRHDVEQVEGLVLVDIDNGCVMINSDSSHGNTPQKPRPTMPKDAADIFIDKCSKFRLQFELLDLQRPFCYNMEDVRQSRARLTQDTNNAIMFASLELMVNLFRGVVHRLRHNVFNRDQFLQEQEEADKPFYEQVFKTDMFKIFLQERTSDKTDYWSDLEMKSRGIGMSKSLPPGPRKISVTQKPRSSSHLLAEKRGITPFHLPDVTDDTTFVSKCVKQLSDLLKDCPDYDDRTSYLYLRSLFYLAGGNTMAALDDFVSLSSSNIRILPNKVLVEVHSKMTDEEKSKFIKKPGYGVLLDIMECLGDTYMETRPHKIQMDGVTIPDRDLKYEEFAQLVSQLEMSSDYDTIRRLFQALNLSTKQAYIEQITFQMFASYWQDNQVQCNQVTIPAHCFNEEEVVLKFSSLTNTDFGIGRIGLSDKRLFFIRDVNNEYREIVKLRNIKALEKSQNVSFLSVIDTLVITRDDKIGSTFTVCLKEERNWWYMIIHEMWAGKVVSTATRDIMAIHQAVQNTLLIDAIIGSGQEECTSHHRDVEGAASLLCYYSDYMRKERHILSTDTKELLQNKIDPNMGELERKTVQALIYTGGEESSMLSPRLWCGLSDGKVKVYNAITWVLESEFVQTKQCVACLTAVGDNHVWAGSFGIFIIDLHTITCNKTLMDHQDLVVDIVLYDTNFAFTASLDGMIIKWDLQKLSHAQPVIHLNNIKSLRSLKIHGDKLLCGSWSNVLICDLKGTVLNTLEYKEDNRLIELDSFAVLSNGEVWVGCRREGKLNVWDCETGEHKATLAMECRGVSIMTALENTLWAGTKDGQIYVFDITNRRRWKVLEAHEDAVRVICEVKDRYTISGGGSKDGRVCIWLAAPNELDSGSYTRM